METPLGKLRRRELTPNAATVDLLLASGDAPQVQLSRHPGSGGAATRQRLQSLSAHARRMAASELSQELGQHGGVSLAAQEFASGNADPSDRSEQTASHLQQAARYWARRAGGQARCGSGHCGQRIGLGKFLTRRHSEPAHATDKH